MVHWNSLHWMIYLYFRTVFWLMIIYDDEKQINPHYLKLINAFGDIKY